MSNRRWSLLLCATLTAAAVFGERGSRAELRGGAYRAPGRASRQGRCLRSQHGQSRGRPRADFVAHQCKRCRIGPLCLAHAVGAAVGWADQRPTSRGAHCPFTSAADLAQQSRARHIAIIIFGPGLGDKVPAIRDALDGVNVLTVASVPDYVQQGVVLGFDVVSGKPKLLVHLTRARRQHVELRAEVLKLMRVFE